VLYQWFTALYSEASDWALGIGIAKSLYDEMKTMEVYTFSETAI
jgi:hypothetical protein